MNIPQQDLKALKEFIWWTADKKNPYVVKGGIKDECYYIVVTDLKRVWYRKADKEIILDEKVQYNRALNVDKFEGVLDLLAKPISSHDKQADYTFNLLNSEKNLVLDLQTVINVYPFRWQFFLNKINESLAGEMIAEDLINPLLCTLKATEMRFNLLQKQYMDLENEYKRKLNEREKNNFKSKIEDNEESWKYLVNDAPLDQVIGDFNLSDASCYFIKSFAGQKIKKKEELEEREKKEREQASKPSKRKSDQISQSSRQRRDDAGTSFADEYVETVDEINNKIEMENELRKKQVKKNKKIDFL